MLSVNDSPSPGRGNELVKTRSLQCLEFVKTTFIGIHCLKKTLLIRERLLMKLQNRSVRIKNILVYYNGK